MKAMIRRLFCVLIIALLLPFDSCERYPEGDSQYCVTCWKEWDDEVNGVYNMMPTKLCDYDLNLLQNSIDDYVDKGYTCGDIREP